MISTIEYARPDTITHMNANMIVFRDFFIFSSSPVASISPIPPHVTAMTASIVPSKIRYRIMATIAHVESVSIRGRSSVGALAVIAKVGSMIIQNMTMDRRIFINLGRNSKYSSDEWYNCIGQKCYNNGYNIPFDDCLCFTDFFRVSCRKYIKVSGRKKWNCSNNWYSEEKEFSYTCQ